MNITDNGRTDGCNTLTKNTDVVVYDAVEVTVSDQSAQFCLGVPATELTATYTGGDGSYTYEWISISGTDTTHNISATASFTPSTTTAGTLVYAVIVKNACGNDTANVATIQVNDTVSLNATNLIQTICLGTAINAVPIEYSGATLSVSTLPAGLTMTNHGDGRDTIYGTPVASQPETTYTITALNENCGNKSITFKLSIGDAFTVNEADSMCAGGVYEYHGLHLTTDGTYSQTYPSMYGCDSIYTITLTIKPVVTVSIEMIPDCEMSQYIIVATTDGDTYEWSSSVDDGQIDAQRTNDTIRVSPTETTTYTFSADRAATHFCTVSETITVNELMVPNARIETHDMSLSPDFTHWTAENASDNGVVSHEWYVNGEFYHEQGQNINGDIDPATNDSYISLMLVAFSQYCSDTAFAQIPIVIEPIYVPNIFTPAAKTNNLFGVEGSGIMDYELWVYSREGLLVFHSTSLDEKWDGTHQGKGTACKQEAYTYKIHYRIAGQDSPRQKFGTVTLIR